MGRCIYHIRCDVDDIVSMAPVLREMGLYGADGHVIGMGYDLFIGRALFRISSHYSIPIGVVGFTGIHVVGYFGFVESRTEGGEIE